MFGSAKRAIDVEGNQQHGYKFKFDHIARREEDGVVVLREVFAALVRNLRMYQQFVVQREVYRGCREEANVPRMVDSLGMFQWLDTTPSEKVLKRQEITDC